MTEALAGPPASADQPAGPQDALSSLAVAAATTEGDAITAAGETVTPHGEAAMPDGEPERPTGPSLSPSRAADFMTCPLLYRFRVIDRLPQPPSPAAARGTLVHAVLERLFDEPAGGRTPEAAKALLGPQWERLVAEEPALAALFEAEPEHQAWLEEATRMLDRYFSLENPARIEPAYREMSVQALLESGLTLRGYIDRLDIAPTGEIRIVDYKTGTAPREEYEARALFQMKFYALALWRTGGTIPRLLQLMYLGNGEIVRYAPDERDLLATERKINALWQAIDRALTSGDWRPRPSRLCDWCSFQALCPAYGGTPPPLPVREIVSTGEDGVATLAGPVPAVAVPPVAVPPVAVPPVAVPAVAVPAEPVPSVPGAAVPGAGAASAVSLAGQVPAQRAEAG